MAAHDHTPITLPTSQLVTVSAEQWTMAINMMTATAAKVDRILEAMAVMPTVISQQESMDGAVSALTQSMTLNSDLITARADTTILESRRTLATRITEDADRIFNLCSGVEGRQTRIEDSLGVAIRILTEATKKMEQTEIPTPATTLTDPTHPTDTALGAGAQEDSMTQEREVVFESEQGGVSDAPRADAGDLSKNSSESDNGEATEPIVPHDNTTELEEEHQQEDIPDSNEEVGATQDEDLGTPPYVPASVKCHACGKTDADMEVCDYCELPHHFDCLIKEPAEGSNRYCNACMKDLYGDSHKPFTQSSIGSDLELSEDSVSSTESQVSEFKSNYRKVPNAPSGNHSQQQDTAPKYKLRERKNKTNA